MDAGLIAGLITAAGGAITAVLGGLALLKKASVPTEEARTVLRSLWDWLTFKDYSEEVPARIRKEVTEVLGNNDHGSDDLQA